MAASLGQIGSVSYYVFYLMLSLELLLNYGLSADIPCAQNCTCTGDSVDCSNLDLTDIPQDLPAGTISINLSHNKLTAVDTDILSSLPNLREVRLDHNELTAIPSFRLASSRIAVLYLQHNKIGQVDGRKLMELTALETLDLSNNDITELRAHCFPAGLQIRDLYLSSNKIVHLEAGAFDQLSSSLQVLRLSRNRLTHIPVKAFQLTRLTQLELSRNRLRLIEGLTFQGLSRLEVLKLQRNNISKLTDGAFWGLAKMRVLHLDFNSLKEVNSGSLYGLTSLQQLYLANNSIGLVNPDGWRFCQKLRELGLLVGRVETPRLDEDMEDRSVVVGDTVALQCKALGSPPPSITWLRGDEPLRPSERHHFTAGNQLLVIRQAVPDDAGRYTCRMSNMLGTERAHCQLSVRPQAPGPCAPPPGPAAGTIAAGIIVIAVVTSVVATSLVWVCIIYQTRKRSEECSVTNTDETIVPPDVPSYLSSQGTLSERQDGSIRVDSSSGSQPNGHIDSNGFDHPVCSDCLENYSKPPDYLLQSMGPVGLEYQQTHHPSGYISVPVGSPPTPLHNNTNNTTTTTAAITINAPHSAPHCNGTPNGIRRDPQAFPSNHDRVASPKKLGESKDPTITRLGMPGSENFIRPIKLSPLTSVDIERGDSEVTQTLLSNGHVPRVVASENTSLRRASD
ncbi:leucine-rich repeats and immunoglobulin-like domains protein 1 [Alosa pseudoharengus]|uniref:leucine-rich repeats and immunoglobulin-like domains protein 1 n=1 Tax=Alosa pseudoharengus TaxID=34774 RepID=UPI003F8C5C85